MDTDSFLNLKVLNSIYVVFTVTIDCSKIKMGYLLFYLWYCVGRWVELETSNIKRILILVSRQMYGISKCCSKMSLIKSGFIYLRILCNNKDKEQGF